MLLTRFGLIVSLAGIMLLGLASRRIIDSLKLGIISVETTQLGQLASGGRAVPIFEGWDKHTERASVRLWVGFFLFGFGMLLQIFGTL
ncbi:MAG: hypothetical protein ACLQDV_16870 [Candidatus Binataceae bacterium]